MKNMLKCLFDKTFIVKFIVVRLLIEDFIIVFFSELFSLTIQFSVKFLSIFRTYSTILNTAWRKIVLTLEIQYYSFINEFHITIMAFISITFVRKYFYLKRYTFFRRDIRNDI